MRSVVHSVADSLASKPVETMTDAERLQAFLNEVHRARRVLSAAIVEKQLHHRTAAESAYKILGGICDAIPRVVKARRKPKRKKGT